MSTMLLLSTESSVNNMAVSATGIANIDAQKGASYTLIDQDTGQYPKNISLQQDNDDLTILQNGDPILVIKQYYQDESGATFLDTGYLPTDSDATLVDTQSETASELDPAWSAEEAKTTEQSDILPVWLAGLGTLAGGVVAGNVSKDDAVMPVDNSYTITVAGTAGYLTSTAQVTVYDNAGNILIQEDHDFSQGNYTYSVTNGYIGTLLITVTDINGDASDYSDETTGNDTSLNSTLRAMAVSDGSGDITINITPLTELATKLAGVGEDNTVSESQIAFNAAIANLFGVDDILALATTVTDSLFDTTDGLSPAENYGVVLAALSGADSASGSLIATLEQLLTEITVADDGSVTITQNGLDTVTAGIAAYNASDAGQANAITSNALSAPLVSNASGGLTAAEVESGVTITVSGVASGDDVMISWGGVIYSYTLTDGDITSNGKGLIAIPTSIIAQAGDGNVAVRYTLGEKSSAAVMITVDTADIIAPAAPNLALATDTGSSNTDGITTDATINVSGLEAGATWQYSLDKGVNWLDGSGTSFELAADTTYAMGDIQIKQTDAAGNVSVTISNTATIITDNTLAAPSLALASDSGSSNSDGITNDATMNVTLAADMATWQYSLDGGANWLDGTGTSFELGANTTYAIDDIQVKQTDTAGNVSITASNAAAITIDNTLAAPGLALATDTGSSSSDGITTDTTMNVALAADVASWQYSLDGGANWLDGTGTSFELGADATYALGDIQVKQTDAAGNVSIAASNAAAITIDNTLAAPGLALATDTGSSNSDGIATDTTMNVALAADVASWQYSLDSGANWLDGTGTSFELGADTSYAIGEIQVKQTDAAGNVSITASNAAAIIIDNTLAAPGLALATDTGSSSSDGITTDTTMNVALAADVASWQYSLDGGANWTIGSGTSFELGADATYALGDIQVKQTDAAGNVSVTTSNTAAIITDNTLAAPGLALATDTGSSSSDGITTDTTMNVTLAADMATWQYSLDGGANWTIGSGTSFELGADATYAIDDIQVKQTDTAGNVSVAASNAAAIIIDNTVAAPGLALATDTGSSSSDGITTDATVNVSGLEVGATWQYSLNSGADWLDGTGTSFELAADNTYAIGSIQVKQTDAAGNASTTTSNAATINVDNTLDINNDLAVTPLDTILNATDVSAVSVALAGIDADAQSVTVSYSKDLTFNESVNATYANGMWSAPAIDLSHWSDGEISYAVIVTDIAGNTKVVGVFDESTLNMVITENGVSLDPNGVGANAQSIKVIIADDDNGTDDVIINAIKTDGIWAFPNADLSGLTGASRTLSIEIINLDGSQLTQVINNVLPAITLDTVVATPSLALATDTGSLSSDGITTDATMNVSGLEVGATWQYSLDGATTWLDGSGTSFELGADASYAIGDIQVKQTDVAGNISEVTNNAAAITVDNTAPIGSLSATPTSLIATNNADGYNGSPQLSAVGNNGAYVVTWMGEDSEGDASIFVQLFNADGSASGASVKLEAIGNDLGNDRAPQVSAIGNEGAYVVTWQGEDSEGDFSIFTQLFAANGTVNGAPVQLEAIGNIANYDYNPQVSAVGNDGAYVVTWYGQDSDNDDSIFVQLFKADGTINGATVQLEAIDNTSGSDYGPQVSAVGDSGAYVVTWQGVDSAGDDSVFVQLFNANGTTNGVTVQLEAIGNASGSPQVSAVSNEGAYVVTWQGIDSEGDISVFVQSFKADGTVNGVSVQLEAIGNSSGNDYSPQVSAVGNDGAYVVIWYGNDSEGDASIFTQSFAANGTVNGVTVQLEAIGNTSGYDYNPQVSAVGNDGAYVVTWQGQDSEGDYSIFVQLFNANGTTHGAAVQLESPQTTSGRDDRPQVSAVGNDGAYVVTWQGANTEIEFTDNSIFVQMFDANGRPIANNLFNNTQSIDVQSSEVGTAYLVSAAVNVSSLTDIAALADNTYNSVAIESINTYTSLAASGLVDGTYYVYVTDVAGNFGQISQVITIDSTAPAAPNFALTTDTGSSDSDGITSDATVNVTLAADVASWQYSLDGGDNWLDGNGTSFELAANTAYAIADIQVKQTDSAGNISATTSNDASITTDTTLTAPSFVLATDTGSSNSDGITNDATMNVTLAADVASWQYSLDGGVNWATGSGTSFELAADATYAIAEIQVKQTDTAGNTSAVASNTATITIDNTAPLSPLISNPTWLEATGNASGTDQAPQVTAVGNEGAYVVTWQGQDSNTSIYVQLFKADGTIDGTAVQLAALDNALSYNSSPQVSAVGNDGGYVVTWWGQDSENDYSVFVQLFNADGVNSSAVQLEAIGNASGLDLYPQVSAVGNDGAYVVTWQGQDSNNDYSVFVQLFNANGSINGAAVQLEAIGNTSGGDHDPQVTSVGNDGAYVVTWQGSDSDGDYSIFVQLFNTDGTIDGGAVQLEAIGNTAGNDTYPQVSAVGIDGAYVVTWQGRNSVDDLSIFVQLFQADGSINGATVQLDANDNIFGYNEKPQVSAVGNGGAYVVTWFAEDNDDDDDSIFVQLFKADGTINGATVQLEATGYAYGTDESPQVSAVGNDGAFVVTWTGQNSDGDYSVFVQSFKADGTLNGTAVKLDAIGNTSGYDQAPQVSAVGNDGAYVVTWEGEDSNNDYSIFVQLFDADGRPVANSLINNTQSIEVQSSEVGSAYLVSAAVAVSSLSDITALADNLYNSVAIESVDTETALAASGLVDGTYYVYVADAAGNFSQTTQVITIDSTAPDAPSLALATDSGSSNSDNLTNDATVNVTLATDVPSWQYSLDAGNSWTTGSGTSFELGADVTYAIGDIQVKQTDAAGNISSAVSNTAAITVDNTGPIGSINNPPTKLEAIGNTSGDDSTPQVSAVGNEGAYVVTWQGVDSDSGESVFVQLFKADGTINGAAVQLEAIGNTSGPNSSPQVTPVGNAGTYVVTWSGKDSNNDYSIFVQLFKADGTIDGSPVQLEPLGNTNGSDYNPIVSAVGSDGAYVVTWSGQNNNNYYYNIFVQLFNADGTVHGAPVQLTALNYGDGYRPQVSAVGNDGAYVVTWEGWDGSDYSIFVQQFSSDGSTNGNTVKLEATGVTNAVDYISEVTALGSGGAYVVTWTGYDSDGGTSIYVQLFSSDGSTNGNTVKLEATGISDGSNYSSKISAVGSDGAYVVTWQSEDSGGEHSIFVQLFKADGTINGDAIQLEASGNTSINEYTPQVSGVGSDGAYVVTWEGEDSEGDTRIFVQLFKADGTFNGDTVQLEALSNGANVSPQVSSVGNDGAYVVTWSGPDSNDDNSIYVQLFDADGRPVANSLLNNTQSIEVQSSEVGSAYLVSAAVAVSSLSDITALADNQYNSVAIESVDTDTALAASGLVDGTYYVYVADAAGNFSQITQVITIDSTASDAPSLALATDSGSSNSDNLTNDATVNVSGLEVGATWQYSLDRGANWLDGSGTSFELAADTTYDIGDIQVKQTDAAGNPSTAASNAAAITTDTTLAAPTFVLATDTGSSSSDGITTDATVNVTLADDVASWQYSLDGGVNWATGTVTSFELAADTTYAIADIQVKQTDAAGNVSTVASNAAAITTDTTLAAPSLALATDTGSSNSDGITTDATVNVTLAADVASWQYSLNGGSTWTTGSGTSFELATDTTYAISSIQVKQTDTAGNASSAASNAAAITTDTTPLAVPSLTLATDTGSSDSDGITTDATVNVTLAADVASWQYSLNGGSTWSTGSDTSFELAADTAYAIADIQVKQTDTAGNTSSAASNAAAITTDTTLATPTFALATDTGSSSSDGITTDATVNVTLADDVASWQYSLNAGSTWATGTGTSFELAADAAYAIGDIQVKQTDAAGNESAVASNAAAITTDTTIATPSFALASDTGSSNSDGITTDATVNVTLAADVASWQYSLNGGSTWTTGSDTSFELAADTTYDIEDIQVKQTDVAGNTSDAATNAAAIITDSTAPTAVASITSLSNDTGASGDFITSAASQTISGTYTGTLATGDTLRISLDNGSTWVDATTASGGAWTLTGATITSNTIQAAVFDTAGNASTAATQAVVLDTTAPTAAATAATISNTENASVQSSELGTAYLVASDISVTSLSDITGSDDNQWNSVAITAANTATDLAATGLVDGSYKVYTTDTAGNLSAASNNTVTIENVDTSIVVFDLTTGQSSSHSGRTFDANVEYTIYIMVDSDAAAVQLDNQWLNAGALGGDDHIVLVEADGGALYGGNGYRISYSSGTIHYIEWGTFTGIAAAITVDGRVNVTRNRAPSSVDIWAGGWAAVPDYNHIDTGLPSGILTSQGLA